MIYFEFQLSGNEKAKYQRKKVRTSAHFYRPATLRLKRSPKVPHKAVHRRNKLDAYGILKCPVNTESALKKIEDSNTIVFIVHVKSNKHQIRAAIKKLYDVDVLKVRFTIIHLIFPSIRGVKL